jgi:hypothetical protein
MKFHWNNEFGNKRVDTTENVKLLICFYSVQNQDKKQCHITIVKY